MVRGTKVVGGMDFKYGEPIYNATPKQQNHWKKINLKIASAGLKPMC
jgi:hypothetical protein